MADRGRHFAMMPCNMNTWLGWTDLTPVEQWAYQLLRRQKDINAAGVITLRMSRWAAESRGVTVDILGDLFMTLAEKNFIVIDFSEGEVLLCWYITTDENYRRPNSLTNAVRAIHDIRSPGIRAALHNEMKWLDESGVVPLTAVPTIRSLIGLLEPNALLGTRQPLHNPSKMAVLPPNRSKAGGVQVVPTPSAAVLDVMFGAGEPSESDPETGQDNRYTTVPSLESSVGTTGKDSRLHTEDFPAADATAPDQARALVLTSSGPVPKSRSAADANEPPQTAQTLVGEWVDWFGARTGSKPPERTKGQVAKHCGDLLAQGIPYESVRRGLGSWAQKNLTPVSIHDEVALVMQGGGAGRRGGPAGVGSARSFVEAGQRVQAAADGREGPA
jgi:hypothetical protein